MTKNDIRGKGRGGGIYIYAKNMKQDEETREILKVRNFSEGIKLFRKAPKYVE